jgi:hypothetical protein
MFVRVEFIEALAVISIVSWMIYTVLSLPPRPISSKAEKMSES